MFAWLTYQWLLNECEGKKLNPIATESFKDFYLHRNKTFLEGGCLAPFSEFVTIDIPNYPERLATSTAEIAFGIPYDRAGQRNHYHAAASGHGGRNG
jgi:hypothetical protein